MCSLHPEERRSRVSKDDGVAADAPALHPNHRAMAGDMRHTHAVRLGLRQVKGLAEADARRLVAARASGPFDSVRDLRLRAKLPRAVAERLAEADAFGSLGMRRRDALWAARGLDAGRADDEPPLFAHLSDLGEEEEAALPPMPPGAEVVNDYRMLRLSLKAHPVSFLRPAMRAKGYTDNQRLAEAPNGARLAVAGLVLVRQRPGTASGVVFATLEDETGVANIVIWPRVFEAHRRVVLGARLMGVEGRVQREGVVVHVIADRLFDLSGALARLSADHGPDVEARARADEFRHGGERRDPRELASEKRTAHEARVAAILPKSRDFH